ncbi:MAG: hypothetical protein GVX78_03355 [Bacteroidetes bacterium]|nr:hypothetical protein [Bacteroidota bacterium]
MIIAIFILSGCIESTQDKDLNTFSSETSSRYLNGEKSDSDIVLQNFMDSIGIHHNTGLDLYYQYCKSQGICGNLPTSSSVFNGVDSFLRAKLEIDSNINDANSFLLIDSIGDQTVTIKDLKDRVSNQIDTFYERGYMDTELHDIWGRYLSVSDSSSAANYIDSVDLYLNEIETFSNQNTSWETFRMTLLIAQSSGEYWSNSNQPYGSVSSITLAPGNSTPEARGPGLGLLMDSFVFVAVINDICYDECGAWPCVLSWMGCSGAWANLGTALHAGIGASIGGYMMPGP